MEIIFDTADRKFIEQYQEVLPITGVTTNPSVLKKDGVVDFAKDLNEIQKITNHKQLHVQVVGPTYELMKTDAENILAHFGEGTYIKVPVNEPGLKLINELNQNGYKTTGTAIYTQIQGVLAIESGATYIAPYYNRMANNGLDSANVIKLLREYIDLHSKSTKILAASFKTTDQVIGAINAGTHAITISKDVVKQLLTNSNVVKAVDDFQSDWQENFKTPNIND